MIPVSLFYVLISWVEVLLLNFVMYQLFESQSYEILDNQTQFFQEHSTETNIICVETPKLKDKLCLLWLFFNFIFIPHICIDAYSDTHFLTLDYSTTLNLLLHKNKITLLIEQKVFNPKTRFGTNIWKDGTYLFAMVISEISIQYICIDVVIPIFI
jgi:hypothetical protein